MSAFLTVQAGVCLAKALGPVNKPEAAACLAQSAESVRTRQVLVLLSQYKALIMTQCKQSAVRARHVQVKQHRSNDSPGKAREAGPQPEWQGSLATLTAWLLQGCFWGKVKEGGQLPNSSEPSLA